MSAVSGCCWFDERPASIDDIRIAAEAARHRARAPVRVRCAGPVALAYADDVPDSCQPFHDPSSRTTLVVDGRIDNLSDLAGALGIERSASAPAVVLAAWRRWGLDCGAHLLGDFVVVVSDEAARRVVCIRDPMGQRPLFHGASAHRIVFGSEAHQVVRQLAVGPDAVRPVPNEGMVAEYLTGDPATVAETLWRSVYRLPPAHTLAITPSGVTVRRYWDFDPEARVEHASADEYAEHFREVFTRAVECRVRDARRVGVLLSGGIDSSSVAGVAQAIQVAAGREAVHAFTVAFPGRPCDETVFSQAVVDKWSLAATRVDAVPPTRAALALAAARHLDFPASPTSLVGRSVPRARRIGRCARRADGLRRRRLLHRRVVAADGSAARGPGARLGPGAGQPGAARSRSTPAAAHVGRASGSPAVDCDRRSRRRAALEDRLRPRPVLPFPTREQQDCHRRPSAWRQCLGDEMEDRAAHAAGIAQRHPFYDRRVAEFGLALPASQRGDGRRYQDRSPPCARCVSAASVSPPERRLPTRPSSRRRPLRHSRPSAAVEAFARLRSENAGWVDGPVIRQMYEDMIQLYSRGE